MKALFGVVSLLVTLAIGGVLAVKQLRATGPVAATPAGAAAGADVPAAPQLSGSGTVAQQSRQLERQVAADVAKAMNAATAARMEESEKK